MKIEIKNGFRRIREKPILLLIIAVFIAFVAFVTPKLENALFMLGEPFSGAFFKVVLYIVIVELALVCILGIIAEFGKPNRLENKLIKTKLVNNQEDFPLIVSKKNTEFCYQYKFYSPLIPSCDFEKYRAYIEPVIKSKIVEVKAERDMQHVWVYAIGGKNGKQDYIYWDDKYFSDKDFEIVVGISYSGPVVVNLSHSPHLLVAGSSGSGKSTLLRLILMQTLKKDAKVYLIDMKGGIDYSADWRKACTFIKDQADIEQTLSDIIQEMDDRQKLLVDTGTRNISEYNKKTGSNLKRIIVAFDELAEALDKTGLDKEQKAQIERIEAQLSKIGRVGRAYGIHLVLSTQRPDCDILKGQIKANITTRYCGYADATLSQIVLDNSDASEKIFSDDKGYFLSNAGILFKAFFVNDDCLKGVDINEDG